MKFWWVNHNRTGAQEVSGSFLWSPKVNSHGGKNQTYDNMLLAKPGEPVLSFRGSALRGVGIVVSGPFEAEKPKEFGEAGAEWTGIGWRLPVLFSEFPIPLVPREHIDRLRPFLPEKYSPLISQSGVGAQAYLFEIGRSLYSEVMSVLAEGWK